MKKQKYETAIVIPGAANITQGPGCSNAREDYQSNCTHYQVGLCREPDKEKEPETPEELDIPRRRLGF
ncbi:MAG: hypothetical protein ABIH77_02785 [Pseudomonadota bacterium]|nr:hypothetical protein [Gammaproteobacteria bacterium]MBU1629119.1 hypothetical protein [Gammaproteobacteria bacterium]MBU1926871.1 hypothetical protein [Gammaproteobacteria bacterium]MBU2546132.1 hypothetical protein [Gammaproteobacteria bacterium]